MKCWFPANMCQHTFLALLGPESTVYDFGANRGEFSHGIIERFGSSAFAAEPIPSFAELIKRHPKLHLVIATISDRNGTAPIKLFEHFCSTLLGSENPEPSAFRQTVETVCYSEFQRRTNTHHVDLLTVDIEGAEFALFDSMTDADLANCDQITVEFQDFLYPEMQTRVEAKKRRIGRIGFRVVLFRLIIPTSCF